MINVKHEGNASRPFHAQRIEHQVQHADSHHQHRAALPERVARKAHKERKDRAAEQAHDHQAGNLVLLLRHGQQGLREGDGEHVAVAETYQCDTYIYNVSRIRNEQTAHGHQHQADTGPQERARRPTAEDERAAQAAKRAEDEVQARGPRSLVERHAQAFHEQLGRRGVRAHVDAHVAHNAQETEQDVRMTQQTQASEETGSLVGLLFVDGRAAQP